MAFTVFVEKVKEFEAQHVLELFALVEQKPWSFLLDSCSQTSLQGRFDIIVSSPCLTYEFSRGAHKLDGDWLKPSYSPASPKTNVFLHDYKLTSTCPYKNLAMLQEDFNQLFNVNPLHEIELPFIVGAVGAFGYDGNTSSDSIIDAQPEQYQLPDISVGFYDASLIYDNQTHTLFICSIHQAFIHKTLDLIAELSTSKTAPAYFELKAPWQSNVSQENYYRQFAKIKHYLRAGDCYQVNYAQRFSAPYQGSEWSAYLKLRAVNKAPFSAFLRLPTSTVLSLSPERFLSVKNRVVETKPIKGTRKRSSDPKVDEALANELLSSEKDRAENIMIVDLLRNDISKYCQAHSVKVPTLFALESYPAVHHMVSTVTGELKPSASVYELLNGAFPGGSITGAPKVRAMQIIQELEPDKRSIYCGSIGYIGVRGDMDTNICIRTLLAEQKDSIATATKILYCWAGGGIVIDSTDSDEYLESLHKVVKILPILEQFKHGDD